MSTPKKKADTSNQDFKKKYTILGVLSVLITVVLIYQYFAASSLAPVQEPPNADDKYKNRVRADQLVNGENKQNPAIQQNVSYQSNNALDISSLENRTNISESGDRNPFEYPPPPPKPQPPPPPPPTIKITTISPTSVYAKTKAFDVVIHGSGFTPDMRIYLQGNPNFSQTILVSDTEIKAQVPESYIAIAGSLQFHIKTPGKELEFFSNPLSLNVVAPQDPNTLVKMIGQFTDPDGQRCAVLSQTSQGETKPTQTVKVNDIVSTNWQVISINKSKMELKDIKQAIGVVWPMTMKDDTSGSVGNVAYNQQLSYEQPQYYNGNPYTDPNGTINLNEALQTQTQNADANGVLGRTAEDVERNKKIQAENYKMINEMMQKQREAITRQRELLEQQPVQIQKNRPSARR